MKNLKKILVTAALLAGNIYAGDAYRQYYDYTVDFQMNTPYAPYYTPVYSFEKGATITNNSVISNSNTGGNVIESQGSGSNSLTLKGDGIYEGNIMYNGDPTSIGNLILTEANLNFSKGYLGNWGNIYISGGKHSFDIVNDALNSSRPRTDVKLLANAVLGTGDGQWGDANFILSNSILNPYETKYSPTFYGVEAKANIGPNGTSAKLYERREFEKLTVNDLTLTDSNSGVVIDIRLSEPDYFPSNPLYDEDDRAGYWEFVKGGVSEVNPDNSYGGYGYSYRYLKQLGGNPTDMYQFQRVNHDKIDVRGSADVSSGSLFLLDQTKWMDDNGHIAEFREEDMGHVDPKPLDHLELDVLDGNISFDDFGNIEFYSNYFGLDHYDNASGKVYLTTSAYNSSVKGQVDWWLKQASMGFTPDGDPQSMSGSGAPVLGLAAAAPMMMSRMAAPMAMSVMETVEPEPLPYEVTEAYNVNITDLGPSLALKDAIYSFTSWEDVDAFLDGVNKLEYASLMVSNLNAVSNRVQNLYTQLENDYHRDANGYSFWFDTYFSNDSLSGSGDHDIKGNGYEIAAGFDKKFGQFTLGFSFNHTDYSTDVNDSGVSTNIDSDGYGLNMFAQFDQGKLTHRAILGYSQNTNSNDMADFDSSDMFASYRAEYAVNKNITLIGGLRYTNVRFDEISFDDENSIESATHDSLETELGVRLSKQFKKLHVHVSAAWMHEMLNTDSSVKVNSSYGSFNQQGIERDSDSFRAAVGASYQLTEKMSIGVEVAKEMSANSDNNSVAAKFRITF